MKIQFSQVSFKNFLSYGNVFTAIALNVNRTSLINGVNGSGKSTVLDAMAFALFNKPFRPDINKPDLMNDITNKDCLVELSFNVGSTEYIVKRGIKPNLFEIYSNGLLINQKVRFGGRPNIS
jgi:DNA repair exonuclease SbcCD ATPase subunit